MAARCAMDVEDRHRTRRRKPARLPREQAEAVLARAVRVDDHEAFAVGQRVEPGVAPETRAFPPPWNASTTGMGAPALARGGTRTMQARGVPPTVSERS
jgi:hypothetical protein